MEWPQLMGGGYHFLKLEGNYIDNSATYGYAMHLGTNNCLIPIKLFSPIHISNDAKTKLKLKMNINEWFKNPHLFDFNLDANNIMGDSINMKKLLKTEQMYLQLIHKYKKGIALLFAIPILACTKEQGKPDVYTATPYTLSTPANFPQPILSSENPLTIEGIKLGRMLYYDPILSTNGRTCNSCHIQSQSYSSPIFTTPIGVKISVPAHINLTWNKDYNWNGSEPELDRLCLGDFGPSF